ncbi:GxGYxYP domain-containing protein [Clostridium gasigenes]|uniref:Protein phosphatase n=1 Tax=Clostridium gasigenes TaxID=94869 RepID=A0A7X0SC68_9CLOT|nr:GxGYxYP domain-containing protein [Clostridium gasigenes]MBB6714882.1 protein phosphatase [Clostridium gasigenes]
MKKSIKISSFILLTLLYSFSPILSYSGTLSDINLMKKPSNCNIYSSFFKDDILDSNDSYIKNSIIPKHLYVISENDMSNEEKTMISTLQGLVATKSDHQIYILSSNEPDYQIWLKDLNDNHNVEYTNIRDPWQLLSKLKNYINGYILYSNLKGPSINNACSLASLEASIVIEESLESKIKSAGVSNLIKDCRDTDKYWAYNNLWNLGLNHSTVIELSPSKYIALRDYSIMSKSLIFYEDDVSDSSLRDTIFKSMDNTSRCLGWGPDEHTNVNIASKFGVDVIASDWSYNLSVLSSYPLATHNQKSNNEIPKEDGVHYITFIMSDGDNQQWFLGSNYSSKSWYGSKSRGNFNLGWSISPSLYYLAPTVFSKYYESASSPKYNDNYVVPPSGNGYMYPSKFPIDKLGNYTKRLNEYMKKVDQKNVLILDDEAFYRKDLWDNYTCHSNINGLFYLNYEKNSTYDGKIIWSNNKPIVSCRDLLWEGLENEEQLINNVNNRINLGYTDIKSPDSYTFVYVHVWSKTMDNVQYVVTKLNENSKVRIVTPDTFMKLIQKNITPTI